MSKTSKNQYSILKLIQRTVYRSYLGEWVFLGILIGLIAGIGAIAFYGMIQLTTYYMLGGITGYYPPNPAGESLTLPTMHPDFLLVPVSAALGGLIAGMVVYRLAPEAEGHGTDEAIAAFHRRDGKIRRRIPVVKAIASAFTIGSGGSGGREGPTAQIAAGFGSFIGEILQLSVRDRRIAVAVGLGAGIGAIFKSPFGGAILSGEILYSGGDFEVEALLPAFIASPVGYVIFASFTGFTPIFGSALLNYSFTNPYNLLLYALLGGLCGLVGRSYTTVFYGLRRAFDSISPSSIPKIFRPMIGAACAGTIGLFFPEVLGLGYGFLQYLISGELSSIVTNFFALPLFLTLVLIVVVKIVATSLTVGSGGSAGVFAPSLVIGGFVGAAFWMVVDYALPGHIPIPAPLVIVGMMALFAGVGRAPIAVILMVSEMTGSLALLAPSMVAVVVSYFVTGPAHTIYRSQVLKRVDSPAHREEYSVPLLSRILVVDAMNAHILTMSPNDCVERASDVMLEKGFRGIPIVDSGIVVGLVTMSDVLRTPSDQRSSIKLESIMSKNPVLAYPDDTLFKVLDRMTTHEVGRLPVVSRENAKIIGIITRTDVMRSYEKAIKLTAAESRPMVSGTA